MADYHAVLQRTLSGFSNPKPELRTKLYERARTTIARQLENRTPAVTGDALVAELDKLEHSIFLIERTYDPSYPEPVLKSAPAEGFVTPDTGQEPGVETVEQAQDAVEPAANVTTSPPEASKEPSQVEDVAPKGIPDEVVLEQQTAPATTPAAPPDPNFTDTLAATPPLRIEEIDSTPVPVESAPVSLPAEQPGFEPLQPPKATVGTEVDSTSFDSEDINAAAVDQWAEEFLSNQPPTPQPTDPIESPIPAVAAAAAVNELPLPGQLEPAPVSTPEPSWPPLPQTDPAAADPYQQTAESSQAQIPTNSTELGSETPFGAAADDDLTIPPAPGFGSGGKKRSRKRGTTKWVVLVVIIGLLGIGGYFGWTNKEFLLEKIGMNSLLDDPVRPKPVKTIAITPETVSPDETIPAAKVESRLTENGQEETAPASNPSPTPALQPVVEAPAPATPASGTVPVSQNAILYEEGPTAAENTVDSGRVVWSVVEEEPTSGASKEPVIRARIEIPSRNVVLIMKIKRNADKALPASHLIELVFAVPDDFSGGAIDQVSRFVLKQSEQARGDGLVGVPARIAEGIFLIALNNLEQAKKQNESLLQSREWIDIPLQYRTGRRALMTIEKGVPGDKVFKEVFEAWSKL